MARVDIEALVADLEPVRRIAPGRALLAVAAATLTAVAAVAGLLGLRPDLLMLAPAEIVVLRAGALLLLGAATLSAVAASARPAIGGGNRGWRWALGAAALFPLASIVVVVQRGEVPSSVMTDANIPWCFGVSVSAAIVIAVVLVAWLRRGAVTDAARAGWLVGLSSGALGTFAYSLHCPSDSVLYAGIWYTAAVALCAGAGRIAVPRLLRW